MKKNRLFLLLLCCLMAAAIVLPAQPALAGEFVQLISPNGGEIWAPGSNHTIKWQSAYPGGVQLFYSLDSGVNWTEITSGSLIPDTGSYQWTVPDTASSKARIKLNWYYAMETYIDLGTLGSGTIVVPYEEQVTSAANFSIGKSNLLTPVLIPPIKLFVFPDAPSELTAEAASASKIDLTWQDNDDKETGYFVERKTGSSGTYAKIKTLDADSEEFTDTGLTANTTYYYRVQAVNGAATSLYSNEASAKTQIVLLPIDPLPIVPFPLPDTDDDADSNSDDDDAVAVGTVVIKLYIGSTEYYINGELETMDAGPMLYQGRTLLPVRYVADPLGAAVGWKAAEQKATVQLGGKLIDMWINNNTAQINGSAVKIDPANDKVTPITVPPGRTMLPIRFISDNLGCKVDWNPALQEVTITYPAP